MDGYDIDPGDARIAALQATCARLEQALQEATDQLDNRVSRISDVNAERHRVLQQHLDQQQVTIDQLWKHLNLAHQRLDGSAP